MADHDELCDYQDRWDAMVSVQEVVGECPACAKIAKVRANEDERIATAIEAQNKRWARDPAYRSWMFVSATADLARRGGR